MNPARLGHARIVLAILLCGFVGAVLPAHAAGKKATQLWNLTGETLDRVELAPAGTTTWGKNQCANDKDGEVDFDEKLPITGISAGIYDVRVRDVHGKTCVARGIDVKDGATFVVHERDLTACTR
jgi:hypothetical protein